MQQQCKWEKVPNVPGFYRRETAKGMVYRFRVDKSWVRVPDHPGEQDAKRWRNKFLGTDQAERILPSKTTFQNLSEVVLGSYRQRQSTKENHERNLRTWLKPLDNLKVQEIDKHVLIQKIIKPMEEKELSGSAVHNCLMTASLVFEGAIDARLIQTNPVKRLKAGVDKPSRKTERKRTTASTIEFAKLLEHSGQYKSIFAVMGLAGLRISECLGLIWGEVMFETMQLNVTMQLGKGTHERVPVKTADSAAKVDMSEKLGQILAAHSLEHGGHDVDFVFTTSNATPYSARQVERALDTACEKAGIPRLTPHELRHTCGSALLVATRDPAITCKQMRHANPNVTLTIYAHEWGELAERGAVGRALDASLGAAL